MHKGQHVIPPLAWAGLLSVSLLWGGSFLAIHAALVEIPVATLVAFRVGIAALALWIYVLAMRLPVTRGWRAWLELFVLGAINNVIPFLLITWGQRTIPTGLAAILNASTAVFGVLLAATFLRDERLTRRRIVGILLGFAGVTVAIGIENLYALDLRSLAQLAVILASVSYGMANVWARLTQSRSHPVMSAAGMLTCSSVMAIPAALLIDGVPSFDYSAATIAAMTWLALLSTALAFIIFYAVLARIGAANTSVTTLLVAPIAILLGAVVLGETLRPSAYLGFLLLTAGLLVLDGRLVARLRRGLNAS